VLANPVRRRLLDCLRQGPRSAGELAAQFSLGRPTISEHLSVLRGAGLVSEEARGRQRFYHLETAGLAEVEDWLRPFGNRHTRRPRAAERPSGFFFGAKA
jgi:DNA-binding transcriptional ArsR family regulator